MLIMQKNLSRAGPTQYFGAKDDCKIEWVRTNIDWITYHQILQFNIANNEEHSRQNLTFLYPREIPTAENIGNNENKVNIHLEFNREPLLWCLSSVTPPEAII